MTPDLLDIARAAGELAKRALPGPWAVCGVAPNSAWHTGLTIGVEDPNDARRVCDVIDWDLDMRGDDGLTASTGKLIAHAGTHHGSLGAALIEAQEEIGRLKALLDPSSKTPAKQIHDAHEAKGDATNRIIDLFVERWGEAWPFEDFNVARDSVYDCSIELDGGKVAVPSREDVEFILGLGFERLWFNRNGPDGNEDRTLTLSFSKNSDYEKTLAWYRERDHSALRSTGDRE
jgi:hypothetical protein